MCVCVCDSVCVCVQGLVLRVCGSGFRVLGYGRGESMYTNKTRILFETQKPHSLEEIPIQGFTLNPKPP